MGQTVHAPLGKGRFSWMYDLEKELKSNSEPDSIAYKAGRQVGITAKAFAIASIDGPVPVMDIIAVGYFAGATYLNWTD